MSLKVRLFLIVGLVLALLVLGLSATLVLAQGPTTTPTAPSGTVTPGPSGTPSTTAPSTGPAQTLENLFWQALAQRLGTTVDKLQAAVTGAIQDTLTQGVKQGLLTQNQANNLQQKLQNVGPNGIVPFGLGRKGNAQTGARASIETAGLNAAAKALNMSTTDLQTALRTQTLLQIAQSKNVDATTLRTAISNAETAAVDAAVTAGQLTQAQATTLKANLAPNNINLNTRNPFGIFGFPGRGFGPGMRGGMGPNGMGPNGMGPNGMGPNGQFGGGRMYH